MKSQTLLSIILILLFSSWVGKDLLQPYFFRSHDGFYHVLRLNQFHQAFTSGQFPVRWAPTLLNGIGYPLFVVGYKLPYYIAELFHLLGASTFTAIKLVLFTSILASAITSYALFKEWSKSHLSAITGSVFFTLAPYRLANVFERGAIGESVAYIFVPLLFLGIHKIIKKNSITLFIVALTGLLLSHPLILIIFFPVAAAYIFVFSNRLSKDSLLMFTGVLISIGLTSFQILPMIFERKFMKLDQNLLTAYLGHFKSPYQLLRIPMQGVNIGTRFQIGITHLLIVFFSFISFINTKSLKKRLRLGFFLSLFAFSVFLITQYSSGVWNIVTPLKFILHPWRFLGLAAFASASLSVIILNYSDHLKILVFLIFVSAVFYTNRHYTKVDQFIGPNLPQEILTGTGTTNNEFDPVDFSPESVLFAQPAVEALDPQVEIKSYERQPHSLRALVTAKESGNIKLGILYFPGWKVKLNDQPIQINTKFITTNQGKIKDLRGLIIVKVPAGNHTIEANFTETPLRRVGNTTSLFTLIILLIFLVKRQFHYEA